MKKTFQDQLIQVRRDHIIEAAIEVIAEQGFQRTTIRQIAKRAGIASGTIYNYFKNKDAIFLAIVSRLTEAEVREMHFAEAEAMDFEKFVTMYVAHRMNEIDADYQSLKVIVSETMVNPELNRTVYEQVYAPSFAVAQQYFQYLMDQGVLDEADPIMMTRLFASPLMGLLLLRMLGDEHVATNWASYTEMITQLLLKATQKERPNKGPNLEKS